ncbi:MAG: glycosyltransferase family 2 protein [Candidatus Melainabacteria bacterium]|nr:glycosyltransferase family 2 protein [Candidatus Melainabacteria bacterium]
MFTLSIVIPLFNEESNVNALYARLKMLTRQLAPCQVEVVFVDDHSHDKTFDVVSTLCHQNRNVRLLRLARNSGSHAAIMAGFEIASGQAVLFMAGDLQDPPELIAKMIKEWQKGHRIVWAARTQVKGQPVRDRLFSCLYWQLACYLANARLPASGVDFALLDRQVVEAVLAQRNRQAPIFLLIAETGLKPSVVAYMKQPRAGGKSGWTLRKKLALVVETLLFSVVPIRIMTVAGAVLVLLSVICGICLGLTVATTTNAPHVMTLIVVSTTILAGLQMATTGVIGEYLYLNMKEGRRVPRYIIERALNVLQAPASDFSPQQPNSSALTDSAELVQGLSSISGTTSLSQCNSNF